LGFSKHKLGVTSIAELVRLTEKAGVRPAEPPPEISFPWLNS
jgi:hypothetical protein